MQHQQDQCNTSKLQTNTVRWRDQHLDAQADEHKREAEKHEQAHKFYANKP